MKKKLIEADQGLKWKQPECSEDGKMFTSYHTAIGWGFKSSWYKFSGPITKWVNVILDFLNTWFKFLYLDKLGVDV